ncbi:alpha/beta hydrolase family protein [Kitasatospora viridis]|uniref:Platelet-activating factor acetylhydrolase isoform II n=1 Tax=Kitasatospora viridis TaxID=281105 RepID=A0A561TWA5_9ACTN|nr:Tat pathway signal protein [Kitasatospora viridis]TWF91397.1 platelet-activating factor acetylhydrolase isoform II [Kitasatospora viridis]
MTINQNAKAATTTTLRALAIGAVAAACTVTAALPAQAAPAAPAPAPAHHARHLTLPAPTGPHQVGEVALHLVDRSRPDPWHPEQPQRQLMVSVFYPAARTAGHPEAPYMLPQAAAHFDSVTANDYLQLGLPTGRADWAGTDTHVAEGAPAARGSYPVVVYSPGLGEPRTWDTTLVADLASRGYVVVTVDNTYESPEVQFPDGSLATMTMPTDPDAFIRKALDVRVADTAFVLDQLQRLNRGQLPGAPADLAGRLDLSKVGMFGHSMGGTAAADAMAADHRIAAGLDMDGNLTNLDGSLMPVAQHGLDRPFLLMGKDGTTDTGPGWNAFEANTPGWTRQLTLKGSQHASFTDAEALLPQLLPRVGQSGQVRANDIGTINPALAIHTTEAYVAAFFDHTLRGSAAAGRLLDGPSAKYPAMEFVH